jgi:hypothetical protein
MPKGAKKALGSAFLYAFAPLRETSSISTITKPPDSNTSDNDRHVDPRISESEYHVEALARSVSRCLHTVRNDRGGCSPPRPRFRRQWRRFPRRIGSNKLTHQQQIRMQRLSYLPVAPELCYDSGSSSPWRYSGANTNQDYYHCSA